MLFIFLNQFPIPIQIFAEDGTSVFANEALCDEFNIAKPDELIGVYNFITDPIHDELGMQEFTKKIFSGENDFFSVKAPIENINAHFSKRFENFNQSKYVDLISFSVWCEQMAAKYIIVIYLTKISYRGTSEIIKAQEYINDNWLEEFSLETIATITGLSISQFSRSFKRDTGKTPYEYYKNLKIDKLKERLCDPDLKVTDAFIDCGLDYNGRYKQFFKDIVGMTPYEYWEKNSSHIIIE